MHWQAKSVESFMYRALLDIKSLYRCLVYSTEAACSGRPCYASCNTVRCCIISVLRVQLMAGMSAGSGSEQLQGLQSVLHIYTLQYTRDADHFVLLTELWCTMIAVLSPAPVGLG